LLPHSRSIIQSSVCRNQDRDCKGNPLRGGENTLCAIIVPGLLEIAGFLYNKFAKNIIEYVAITISFHLSLPK